MMSSKDKESSLFMKTMTLSPLRLLRTTMKEFNFFEHIYSGKLTGIVDHINGKYDSNEITYIACCKDDETEKSGLDLAVYLGYANIALYLLSLGANQCQVDKLQRNTIHTVAYRGDYDCAVIILNYLRYVEMKNLYKSLYECKHAYKFKNLDIDHGNLASTVLHDEDTKKRFEEFNASIQKLLSDYCESVTSIINEFRLSKAASNTYASKISMARIQYIMVLNQAIHDAIPVSYTHLTLPTILRV